METSTEDVLFQALTSTSHMVPFAARTEAHEIASALARMGYVIVRVRDLPDRAHARRGDPDTALQAADSIDDMNERHRATLAAARTFSVWGFTYEMLEHRYQQRRGDGFDLPEQTPQSIRSRCAELRRAGWIEDTGNTDLNIHGRPCKVWRAVPR